MSAMLSARGQCGFELLQYICSPSMQYAESKIKPMFRSSSSEARLGIVLQSSYTTRPS